jgi:TPR repeat protein
MGKRFRDGVGVEQNAVTAAKWFMAAADRGHARAQHHLGVRYLNGNGVEKDPVAALMWLTLSARAGDRTAAKERDKLISRLPREQVGKAESMADKWRPKEKQANG